MILYKMACDHELPKFEYCFFLNRVIVFVRPAVALTQINTCKSTFKNEGSTYKFEFNAINLPLVKL